MNSDPVILREKINETVKHSYKSVLNSVCVCMRVKERVSDCEFVCVRVVMNLYRVCVCACVCARAHACAYM